jgi:hypothetical protein
VRENRIAIFSLVTTVFQVRKRHRLANGSLRMNLHLQPEDLGEKNLGIVGIGRRISKSRSQICS